ncbi:hypothetical protein Bbelb_140960 [Branchiostoma belcheri]|nr:hypothetical protein Bbelb_140960 [Branchiostoma belcheri]
MFAVLRHYGIPEAVVDAISVLYKNSKSVVLVEGQVSEHFCVSTGVLQGDVLAPFLFIILIDYLLRRATADSDSGIVTHPRASRRHPAKQINDLDFADDIALLESTCGRAQEQLTKTSSAAAELDLVISVLKTEYMCYNTGPGQSLQVYGEPIKQVQDFRYLGSMVASSSNDLKKRRALAWVAFWKLEHLWRSECIPFATKVKLFKASCVSVLSYGCESWVITKDMENKINSFATSCYRIMLNIKRRDRVTNDSIYNLTQTSPLIQHVRRRQLNFLGHILRMPEDEPVRLYALYVPSHGRRRRGRQPTSYFKYVQRLLGDEHNQLTEKQIANLASDKGQRRGGN